MKISTALKGSAEHGGPIALSAGVAALTVALVSSGHGGVTAAAQPAPTVTTTVTAPAPEPARTSVVAHPNVSPTSAGVMPVNDRREVLPHTSSGGLSHAQARPPSTPQPSPPSAAPCGGRVLSMRALNGRACLSVGR